MNIRTWAKILPYFFLEWVVRQDQKKWIWVVKKNPYDLWNHNKTIDSDEIERYHVFEFSKDCKLIVSDKCVIRRKIEKTENELNRLKRELEDI